MFDIERAALDIDAYLNLISTRLTQIQKASAVDTFDDRAKMRITRCKRRTYEIKRQINNVVTGLEQETGNARR